MLNRLVNKMYHWTMFFNTNDRLPRKRSLCLSTPKKLIALLTLAITLFLSLTASAQTLSTQGHVSFDPASFTQAPKFQRADDIPSEDLNAIYYEGLPYQGQPTQVFAYYGLPAKANGASSDAKVPAVVLVHGGGGTAFARWVKLWNDRGYAAIAMDLCGCIPVGTYGNWQRHKNGGPPGWDASFDQIAGPLGDQWQTHAVTAVARANSLLRSLPEVDAERIGLTGISWGGYMTCLAAGVDERFKCAVPVYGCGYLGDNSAWLPAFERLGKDKADQWLKQWDPSIYIPKARMPFLWVNGTNDFAYPMDSWERSIQLSDRSQRALRIRMPHGHGAAGENPEEIHVFMNSILKGGKPLPSLGKPTVEAKRVSLPFKSEVAIKQAELCYTTDSGKWQDRKWLSMPATIASASSSIGAEIPEGATVWYVNVFDERDCVVSTGYVEH